MSEPFDKTKFFYDFSAIKPSIVRLNEAIDKAEFGLTKEKFLRASFNAIGDSCCAKLAEIERKWR